MHRFTVPALIACGILHAADYRDINKTVALSAKGYVTIETHKGSIRVITWDRPEIDIKARIEAEPGSPVDHRLLDATEVRIDSSGDSVRIQTRYPDSSWLGSSWFGLWDNGTNPEVKYTIQMPRTARLTIRDHRSDTEIWDLKGTLDLDTHRGKVQVHRLSGPLKLTTHRGEVKVEFAAFTGHSSIETHRGTIELALRKDARFDLETDLGKHAAFNSDFTMLTRSGNRTNDHTRGAVNGGGPVLRIETHRGQIRVRAM